MTKQETRLKTIERRVKKPGYEPFVIFWTDDPGEVVTVDGEKITQAEYNRRYPDTKVITWPNDDDPA